MIDDGLFVDEHSHRPDRSTLNVIVMNISFDQTEIYPFVKTCMLFNNFQDISWQNKFSCAWQREGRKKRLSIVDCVPFYHKRKLIDTLGHAYCICDKYQ